MSKQKINSLQALRGIMILFVCVEHASFSNFISFFAAGGEAVAFFIVLSGFVMAIAYKDRIDNYTWKDSISFAYKKTKKFYKLHVIALLGFFAYFVLFGIKHHELTGGSLFEMIEKAIVNLLFIQVYIPDKQWYMNSLNGVAWYLSNTVFFYFIFIVTYRWIKAKFMNTEEKDCKMRRKIIGAIAILILIRVVILGLLYLLRGTEYVTFISYVFPPFRAIEFIVGLLLGVLYLEKTKEPKDSSSKATRSNTMLEFLVVLLWIANHCCIYAQIGSGLFIAGITMIVSMLLVTTFANEKGYITKMLSNRALVYLGNISFEIYILHQVVIRYVTSVLGWSTFSSAGAIVLAIILAGLVHKYFEAAVKKIGKMVGYSAA